MLPWYARTHAPRRVTETGRGSVAHGLLHYVMLVGGKLGMEGGEIEMRQVSGFSFQHAVLLSFVLQAEGDTCAVCGVDGDSVEGQLLRK